MSAANGSPQKRFKDRRRTFNVSSELLAQLAIADVKGWPLNGSGNGEQFDHEERDDSREQQLHESSELRELLVDWLGEEHYHETMDLFVDRSTRQIDPDSSKAHRRKAAERPLVKRMILLGMFRSERAIASAIRLNLELCRITSMAETARSTISPSTWMIVSPRTARSICNADAWAVAMGNHQVRHRVLSESQTSQYIRAHTATLFTEQDAYLSVRPHDGLMVLDVVKLFTELDGARSFARSIAQRWITNLKTQETVDVEEFT